MIWVTGVYIYIVELLQLHKHQLESNGDVRGRVRSPGRYVLPISGRPFLLVLEDWSFT